MTHVTLNDNRRIPIEGAAVFLCHEGESVSKWC